jgi:N-acetylglucosamine-6-phosphate deacetylase
MTDKKIERFSASGIHYATGRPVRIDISDGRIVSITETEKDNLNTGELFIAPGLIDNQINGYANIDFSGNELSPEGFVKAAQEIWKTGVTTFLPTLITNSRENLIRNFGILTKALEMNAVVAGSVPGFHLEGPYISSGEGYRGCHPVQYTRKPSWEEFGKFQEAAGGKIIEVTLAPELEGADEFIKLCASRGIVVAMGHTNSLTADVARAVECGVRLSTHLGNGCANMIHRHNNPIWPQLAEERLTPTLIADGLHLLPEELKVFLKVKGAANIILTSDVMYLAGMNPGRYTFMDSEVELTEDGMLKNVELNCLAGASFPLLTGVGNMMKFTGCSLEDAFGMASSNPARIYNFTDRGSLSPGKRADIILFEVNDYQLKIRKTILNGKLVHEE